MTSKSKRHLRHLWCLLTMKPSANPRTYWTYSTYEHMCINVRMCAQGCKTLISGISVISGVSGVSRITPCKPQEQARMTAQRDQIRQPSRSINDACNEAHRDPIDGAGVGRISTDWPPETDRCPLFLHAQVFGGVVPAGTRTMHFNHSHKGPSCKHFTKTN